MLDRPSKEKGFCAPTQKEGAGKCWTGHRKRRVSAPLPRRRVLVNVGQAIEREGFLRPTQKEGAGKCWTGHRKRRVSTPYPEGGCW